MVLLTLHMYSSSVRFWLKLDLMTRVFIHGAESCVIALHGAVLTSLTFFGDLGHGPNKANSGLTQTARVQVTEHTDHTRSCSTHSLLQEIQLFRVSLSIIHNFNKEGVCKGGSAQRHENNIYYTDK